MLINNLYFIFYIYIYIMTEKTMKIILFFLVGCLIYYIFKYSNDKQIENMEETPPLLNKEIVPISNDIALSQNLQSTNKEIVPMSNNFFQSYDDNSQYAGLNDFSLGIKDEQLFDKFKNNGLDNKDKDKQLKAEELLPQQKKD